MRAGAGVCVGLAALGLLASPFVGRFVASSLWAIEPLGYVSGALLIVALAVLVGSYAWPSLLGMQLHAEQIRPSKWSEVTQHYFDVFHHDLGRPLARIVGKERELRASLRASGAHVSPEVADLLDEIERQAPSFRLMMSNIQVLIQLESPDFVPQRFPVEPAQIVSRIVARYMGAASEQEKRLSWWAEPEEFGIVYADPSVIEHVITNLVDNAMRFADTDIEVRLTRNPSHFFIRVWDNGPGIPARYLQHLFDRGWTPEAAQRDEKRSSGLGLFIARTLAVKHDGQLTVESVEQPADDHHTAFLLTLPVE